MDREITKYVLWMIFLTASPAYSQVPVPDTLWSGTYGGYSIDECYSVQQTADGGFILGGETYSFGGTDGDMCLVKTDSEGNLQWFRIYGGAGYDAGKSVLQAPDGGYVVGGLTYSFGPSYCSAYLVKTDSQGNTQWQQTYGGGGYGHCESLQQTSDGGYILAGYTGLGWEDGYIVKTDENGDLEWEQIYGGGYIDKFYSVQQTTDGGYILGGSFGFEIPNTSDMWLVKTDAQGDLDWERNFGGDGLDKCQSVLQTVDGGYILGGWSNSFSGTSDMYLVKTDSLGNVLWQQTYGSTYFDICRSVLQTPDMGYILSGAYGSCPGGAFWVVKTDSLGNLIWDQYFNCSSDDECYSMSQTTDGGFVLGGGAEYSGVSEEMFILRLDGLLEAWVNLTPQNPSITIPASGGSFQYNAGVTNCGTVACTIEAWVMVTLPDSSSFGPVLGPVELTLPTGVSLERSRTQYVPANAPAGVYTYSAYVGRYPSVVWHQDSFTFEKLPGSESGILGSWENTGESFEGWLSGKEVDFPVAFLLSDAYPNPFNSTTNLRLALPEPTYVDLKIYNVWGRKVATLIDSWRNTGHYEVIFEASNLTSGVYFAHLSTGKFQQTQKLLIIK